VGKSGIFGTGFFMQFIFHTTIETPVGFLELKSDNESLLAISFVNQPQHSNNDIPEILKTAVRQLDEYFMGNRKVFELKLNPEGTPFQQKIWDLVKHIPFGKTVSYLDIAKLSGSEKNTRAVGLANGKNPIPVIIPCHRVIGTSGKLTGYAGGMERKQWLLQHELKHEKPEGFLF
jgi:methylated-DNA-[protein]-cysteine S-methyltransferase